MSSEDFLWRNIFSQAVCSFLFGKKFSTSMGNQHSSKKIFSSPMDCQSATRSFTGHSDRQTEMNWLVCSQWNDTSVPQDVVKNITNNQPIERLDQLISFTDLKIESKGSDILSDAIDKNKILDDEDWLELINEELPSDEVVVHEVERKSKASTMPSLSSYQVESESSIFKDLLICPICQSEYCVETGDPRILHGCGHYICSNCIARFEREFIFDQGIFTRNVECPSCRTYSPIELLDESETETKNDYSISTTLKNSISKYKERTKILKDAMPIDAHHKSDLRKIDEMGVCKSHSQPIHFGCVDCEEWVCGTCVAQSHSLSNKPCNVFTINEAIIRQRNKVKNDLIERVKSIGTDIKCMKSQIKTASEICMPNAFLIEIIKDHLETMNKWVKFYKNSRSLASKKLTVIAELIENLNNSSNTFAIKKAHNSFTVQKTSLSYHEKRQDPVFGWINYIEDMSSNMGNLCSFRIADSMPFYKTKYAQITAKENSLHLCVDNRLKWDRSIRLNKEFFNPSDFQHYAYIDVRRDQGSEDLRLKFDVEKNVLGSAFLMKCNSKYKDYTFIGSNVDRPMKKSKSICIGETNEWMNNFESDYHIHIGKTRKDYERAISRGAIGLYNSFQNNQNVSTRAMILYIHCDSEDSLPQVLPYIGYNKQQYKLQFCFGQIIEGLEELEALVDNAKETIVVTGCGVLVEECSSANVEECSSALHD